MDELTQGLLRELFDYKDGELYWKQSGTGRKIGVPAGTVKSDGYRSIGINGKIYLTHRLIFLYHHDYLPEFLDHIDGNPLNNNILNLREATKQENAQNAKKYKFHNGKPTSSKFKGVSWNKRAKKWESNITTGGKKKFLGYYDSEIDAAKAYIKAETETRGEFARSNYYNIKQIDIMEMIKWKQTMKAISNSF